VAELLTSLIPNAEQAILAITGTQAVEAAVRAARAYTGRPKIVKIEGGYHGSADGLYVSVTYDPTVSGYAPRPNVVPQSEGMSPGAISDVLVAPWNDAEAIRRLFEEQGATIAALLVDPIQANAGLIPPLPDYLRQLRELTRKHGVVLIFDEVISGFRIHLRGAQAYFGVDADLAVFGKAIAGGVAMSAVTGPRAVLEPVSSYRAHHLGTFNGNPLACVAAIATIEYLEQNQQQVYPRFDELGQRLADGLRQVSDHLAVRSLGSILNVAVDEPTANVTSIRERHGSDIQAYRELSEQLLYQGVLAMPYRGLWYLSTTHTESEVDFAIEATARSLEVIGR
jgi:glutamate-1-semialdehyde 2,1-aminomutase